MDCKTGFISKELPHPKMHNSGLYWFNEIEALYAFLLSEPLSRIFVDGDIQKTFGPCALRYQKLIEQMYPNLRFLPFDMKLLSDNNGVLRYYPSLETLFKNGDLKSVFQPIISTTNNKDSIIGFECLSRLQYNNVPLAPDFLFNYAQEKLQLSNYDKVCLLQALSLAPHQKGILIFVNVRPQTLISTNFYPWLKEQLKKFNLDPKTIVIEITEQYCVMPEQQIAAQCELMRSLGIKIAIDDFGSGLSNLSLLQITKPDFIKISGRFTKNAHCDKEKQLLIKNILDLAQAFNIKAIIENVETSKEWEQVKALGVRLAQGFYFYRPMSQVDILHALNKVAALTV